MNRQAAGLSLFSMLAILTGFVFQLVIAFHFGAGSDLDAFLAATAVPMVFVAILSVSLNSVMVPLYLKVRESGEAGNHLVLSTSVLIALTVILAALVVAGIATSRQTLGFFMGSLPPETLALAFRLSPITWITMTLNVLFVFCASQLQARERYALQGSAPFLGNIVAISCTWFFGGGYGVWALAVGSALAALFQVLLLFPSAFEYKPGSFLQTSHLREMLRLSWPLLISGLLVRSTPLLERSAAAHFEAGTIARLNYAFRIMTCLMAVTTSGIAVVALPALAKSAGDGGKFKKVFAEAVSSLFFVIAPVLCVSVVLADDLARLAYLRGSFTLKDLAVVSVAMRLYAPYVLFAAIGVLIGRAFYALQLTRVTTALDILGITAYGLFLAAAARWGGGVGIPLAMSLYYVVFTVVAGSILFKRVGFSTEDFRASALGKIAFSSVLLSITAWTVKLLMPVGSIVTLVTALACAGLAYVLSAWALGVPEVIKLVSSFERFMSKASDRAAV